MKLALNAVLEGPDACGKTTLAAKLQTRYSAHVLHAGPPAEGTSSAGLCRQYANMVAIRNEVTENDEATIRFGAIADRWALGETVYGPLFRGKSLVGPLEWRALCGLLDATNTPLILCLPPRSVAFASFKETIAAQRFPDPVAYGKVYDKYESWGHGAQPAYQKPRWSWVYDYTRSDALLFEFLDALAARQA